MRKGRHEEEREREREIEKRKKERTFSARFFSNLRTSSKYSRLSCPISFSILRIFLSFHNRNDYYQLDNFVFHYRKIIYIYITSVKIVDAQQR